jgi:hypothetical protein
LFRRGDGQTRDQRVNTGGSAPWFYTSLVTPTFKKFPNKVTKYWLYKPCPISVLCHCIQEPWLVYNVSPHWLTKRDDLVISENILFSLSKDNLFVVSVEIALGEYRLQNCYNECLFPTVIKLQEFMLQVIYLILIIPEYPHTPIICI